MIADLQRYFKGAGGALFYYHSTAKNRMLMTLIGYDFI
jgi:hypothetical protein